MVIETDILKFLALSYTFILFVILFDRKMEIGLWKELAVNSILSLIQLIGIGAILIFLLKFNSKLMTLSIIIVMNFNASWIALSRFKLKSYEKNKIFCLIFLTILIVTLTVMGPLLSIGFVTFKPTKIIPMCGIIVAGGMRALSLSFNFYKARLGDLEDFIVSLAAIGASDMKIFSIIFKEILKNATIPMRDMMKAAGIVHIPGIMVGLLMAGTFPLKAAIIQFTVLSSMLFEYTLVPTMFMLLWINIFGLKIETV
ncbi:ABC transporter permease [Desulfurobacterium sp.]|uniref:ABC transporter permease n=1 Tax=Desulfurobacterium sp. TaxID=2004706 RepID=UPI00260E19DE|nr:ABC transporter permease [Desulfurobacterium sp.]